MRTDIRSAIGRSAVHPFPARMAPEIAANYMSFLRPGAVVLDPMVGSGTTLAIAQRAGLRSVGFDVDPLAVLLARVWTTPVDHASVLKAANRVHAGATSAAMQQVDALDSLSVETATFIRYWFDRTARIELAALASAIRMTPSVKVRDVLWCAFSRLIISKSSGASRARDLAHSRPHRAFNRAPRRPLPHFLVAVESVLTGVLDESSDRVPASRIEIGDARRLPLRAGSVDLVFTSPPYLNAIDYIRCSKFSLVWMGYGIEDLRGIRHSSIGTEASGDPSPESVSLVAKELKCTGWSRRIVKAVARYADDTAAAISEIARVLGPRGRAVYVLGENVLRGSRVRTGRIVELMADRFGMRLVAERNRLIPSNRRYLPAPHLGGEGMHQRMSRELVLELEKN